MKRTELILFLIPLLMLGMFPAGVQAAPIAGDIDPYTVTLYEGPNYDNPIGTWKLGADKRMLRVPQIDKVPSSILLGSKVSALLFTGYNYSSRYFTYNRSTRTPTAQATRWYLISHLRFVNASPRIEWPTATTSTENIPYTSVLEGLSLVVYRKDIHDMLGVLLESGVDSKWDSLYGQFYALPDDPDQSETVYYKIPYSKDPLKLSFVAGGGNGSVSLGGGSPSVYDLVVTVTSEWGQKLYLPDKNNLSINYDLTKYNVGQISSILLQYRGPWKNKESYRAGQITNPVAKAPATTVNPVVNAPPSGPDTRTATNVSAQQPADVKGVARKDVLASAGKTSPPAIPDLSGQWKSSIGSVYDIAQKGNQFEWTVAKTNEKAQGTVQGSTVSASWKGPQGSGSATGQITKVDASGKATQIEWKNGVRFYR